MSSIPRYKITKKLLGTLSKATQSSLLERETSLLIYGAEVFANLPNKLSKHRKDKVKSLELAMHQNLDVLGLNSNFLKKLILTFKK